MLLGFLGRHTEAVKFQVAFFEERSATFESTQTIVLVIISQRI